MQTNRVEIEKENRTNVVYKDADMGLIQWLSGLHLLLLTSV